MLDINAYLLAGAALLLVATAFWIVSLSKDDVSIVENMSGCANDLVSLMTFPGHH